MKQVILKNNLIPKNNNFNFEIVEKFISLSGEAPTLGQPILIIRFSHCNLQCSYCDTKYCNEVNETLSYTDLKEYIISKTNNYNGLKVMFTGGEPLFKQRSQYLLKMMNELTNIQFYIETNGSLNILNGQKPNTQKEYSKNTITKEFSAKSKLPSNAHFVVDMKTPSSGMKVFAYENLDLLRSQQDCIKFVVADSDLKWCLERIKEIRTKQPMLSIYISPQEGNIKKNRIADFILNNKLNVNMGIQLHKILWGEQRGV